MLPLGPAERQVRRIADSGRAVSVAHDPRDGGHEARLQPVAQRRHLRTFVSITSRATSHARPIRRSRGRSRSRRAGLARVPAEGERREAEAALHVERAGPFGP